MVIAPFMNHLNNSNCWIDHIFGMCYTNDDSEFMYINIPKNASTWTNQLFKISLNFSLRNFTKENLDKKAIVVLRDPLDRWCAGMSEYFARRNLTTIDENYLKTYLDKLIWDEHTEKQTMFLPKTKETYYFYLDENYEKNIKQFILKDMGKKNWWNTDLSKLKYRNKSIQQNLREEMKNIFINFSKDPDLLERIKECYKLDYELINSVKFYNGK